MERDYQMWHDREHLLRLDNPERELMMPKAPVLAALSADFGMRVADIGAGIGYFSLPLAVAVGESGVVFAVDPSPAAREELKARAKTAGFDQVTVLDGDAASTHLEDRALDRVLWHTMYHEVPDRERAFDEMLRVLKPGGQWVLVDWQKIETPFGPPLEHRFALDEVISEITQRGFREVRRFEPGPVTWGLVVERP